MKCVSCNVDVPVAFVKAIEANVCPGCDGPIQNQDSIDFMAELADAFERMPNDPRGIAGWILSNYRLSKINDEQPPAQFYRPGQVQQQNIDDSQLKVAPDVTNKFFNRAGLKTSRQQQLIEAAKKIKAEGNFESIEAEEVTGEGTEFANVGGIVKQIPADDYSDEYDEGDIFAGDDMEDQAYLMQAQAQMGGGGKMDEMQRQKLKKMHSQENFESGGGVIRRHGS